MALTVEELVGKVGTASVLPKQVADLEGAVRRLAETLVALDARLGAVEELAAALEELAAVDRWALRGVLTVMHPPHKVPPAPPSPAPEAARSAVPPIIGDPDVLAELGDVTVDAAHELSTVLLHELGGRLTPEEAFDGP